MDKEKFEAAFPIICTTLVRKIMEENVMAEEDSLRKLYSSHLYEKLENEDTKVWHYSSDKLFDLFKEEMCTGEITFPQV